MVGNLEQPKAPDGHLPTPGEEVGRRLVYEANTAFLAGMGVGASFAKGVTSALEGLPKSSDLLAQLGQKTSQAQITEDDLHNANVNFSSADLKKGETQLPFLEEL